MNKTILIIPRLHRLKPLSEGNITISQHNGTTTFDQACWKNNKLSPHSEPVLIKKILPIRDFFNQ
jgi:hypothetical protein